MTCRWRRCFARPSSAEWHRPRWRYLALMAVVIALLIAVVIGLAYDKRVAAVFVASSIVVFALLRGIAAGADGAGAAPAAHALHHAAAGDRQHLPARRADAVGGDVARPRACGAGHDHPDRRQSAAAIPGGAAGARAVVLFHRYSLHRSRPLRRLSSNRPRRNRRSRTCRCCAGASSPPAASRRKTSSLRPIPNGCCRATAA